MAGQATDPIIVQSDHTVLVETASPRFEEARDVLTRFAELEKSPEHIHTYRITPLSLWNAAAAGLSPEEVEASLVELARYEIPENVLYLLADTMSRYGKLILRKNPEDGSLTLEAQDSLLLAEVVHHPKVKPLVTEKVDSHTLRIAKQSRGMLKQIMIKIGYPVRDLAGYNRGAPLDIKLRSPGLSGASWDVRPYQKDAVSTFHAEGSDQGGAGVIVLPCGAGKTVVGISVMSQVKQHTLVLTTSITALRQWRAELLERTELSNEDIAEYSGEHKEIGPVTLTTYQILTWRRSKEGPFEHFDLFDRKQWGLIVYDEVHLLPAPVFRATADIQARRRLGLTATLVREDGLEGDVFSLIGPKKYDIPWRQLEHQGFIATALCLELRVPFANEEHRLEYAISGSRQRFKLASQNPAKLKVIRELLQRHPNDRILVIGQYIDQLRELAAELEAPLITGTTPNRRREVLYKRFRDGEDQLLVVSKVANFAIDLPDANVAIQVSGTFGSRQEEAQRLGRILRPKSQNNTARFYTVVTRDSVEQDYAAKRQLFLTEQGYQYSIQNI